ncbi:MAG TPA: hypothetical protein VL463_31995 [Kofleriaceae bacterium]|nr:hypothetical protein [Kofleriaceae bacterium]
MRYLFGDSSESDLDINYLAFLRDAVDFGVAILQADAGLAALRDKRGVREHEAGNASRSVEDFGRSASSLTEPLVKGDAPLNRCAASIAQATADAVKREVGRVKAQLQQELEQIDGETRALHDRSLQALAKLLAAHDLPGAVEQIAIRWAGSGFTARLTQRAKLGLEATLALDIPAGSMFAHELRVEKVGDGIEVHAPETAGWLKKEVKMVPHRLGRHFVTEVIVTPAGVSARVRTTHDPNVTTGGFDLAVSAKGDVTVARAGDPDGAFGTDERDLAILRAFAGKLEEAARALRTSRGAVVEAKIDAEALAAHQHPRVIVERLVASMAPIVAEIARRCPSPRELVLKRLLGGDRREEIFLPRSELVAKLEPLSIAQRHAFAPLGIVDDPGGAPDVHRAVTVQAPADMIMPAEASQPAIEIEAEPPPEPPPVEPPRTVRRTAPPPLPTLPKQMIQVSGTTPGPSSEATAAAVDAALRDLDDPDSGPISSAPRPERPPTGA